MENDRLLSNEEVELLLNLSISAEKAWDVLTGTSDDLFLERVADLFSDDIRVRIQRTCTGCETLIACARTMPDLLILDANLPDISSEVLIHCIREDNSFSGVRILCRLPESHRDIPDWGADDYLTGREDLDKIYLARKVYSHIYPGEYPEKRDRKGARERQWPRTRLNIRARLEVLKPGAAASSVSGDGLIENISLNGAYITGISLPGVDIREDAVSVVLKIDNPVLHNWSADSVVVRLAPEGGAGVHFTNVALEDRAKLLTLFP
ncbi:MAG: hypothetical protein ACYC9O_13145 [Candidatus Latescibacterota bacterium]